MKKISIVTPCYNEEDNVYNLHTTVKNIFKSFPQYEYEHIFIDNASVDNTVSILKDLSAQDPNVKIIVNSRNFGHIRSPYYGLLQATGDAVISMAADFQEPPALIPQFIKKWEEGFKVVVGIKIKSNENKLLFLIRKMYYSLIRKISDVQLIDNFTGFGLYDRQIIEVLAGLNENYPYFRGLISEIGFERATVEFVQPRRERGITKNNFYTLYDMAMLGITSFSKVPLRLATMAGFTIAGLSLLVALIYFIMKLILWQTFSLGLAPIVIGLFFFSSVQLIFIGIIGEYLGTIYTKVTNRPLVIEKERINFDNNK
ncbi:MAG TPA: glycosyltransferase family 2 protein [Clostridia bacterium]|nr:glycosyltransferase family 2 protein [Clostridia bacterium]